VSSSFPADRSFALERDAADPLAAFRDRFLLEDPSLIYLDGNSLGMLPLATADRIAEVVRSEWGTGLVRSWSHWIGLPGRAGDMLGSSLLGAAPGQVAVCDSTTVNLYKLARAALGARPGRPVIVTDDDNFPTDRYVLAGIAAERGAELRMIHTDLDSGVTADAVRAAVDSRTALVSLSHVAYRSGALADMAEITGIVHDVGALALWDLCHSAGAVPVTLDACGADLAVGCTYKYLNAGPGAPAFLYVSRRLQTALRQPIQGWFGQRAQFEMGPSYDPVPGIGRFLTGTPDIAGTAAVEEGARLLAEAGIARLREKGSGLTEYLIALADAWLAPFGCAVASPRDADRRGSHVCLRHPEAWRIGQALIRAGVIGDYRTPDRLRLGPVPITTRYADVWDAMDATRRILADRDYEDFPAEPAQVT
jgi:kynureninase